MVSQLTTKAAEQGTSMLPNRMPVINKELKIQLQLQGNATLPGKPSFSPQLVGELVPEETNHTCRSRRPLENVHAN